MPEFKFANFIATELEEGISAGATSMNIPVSVSALLPELDSGEEIRLVLWDGQQDPEIVGVTANPQTGVLTIERAKESTTAVAWEAGTQVRCVLTAEIINAALEAFFDLETVLEASFLPLAGGTLTGNLTLSGPPSDASHAATKAYVDLIGAGFLAITGGTMTGAINMGSNSILGLAAPSVASAAANKGYVDSVVASGVKWKDPVRVATTANGTFSTAFDDGSTVDGVALATGDRILIKDQTAADENGIYVVQASGSPVRATDADANDEVPGATVFVEEGDTNAATQWTCTNTSVVLGTDDILFSLIAAGVLYTADDSTLQLVGTVFSVKDLGVTAAKLAADAVTTAKILDAQVTFAKMAAAAIADQSTAETGSSSTTLMTPQRTTQHFAIRQASTAEVLAESAVVEFISPDRLKNSQRVAKAWGTFNSAGTLLDSFGVTSMAHPNPGHYDVTLSSAMANANYAVCANAEPSADGYFCGIEAKTTTVFRIRIQRATDSEEINTGGNFIVFGDI